MRARRDRSFDVVIESFISNFRRSELPLPTRLAVTARNLARRAVFRRGCCGHHGEPGC